MGEIFLNVLNMSIAASWLILAVVLLRFVLKKAPKWIGVLLWGIVALRLVVPFSFESALSLVPSAETFNAHNIQYEMPAISSGIPAVNNAVNPVLGETFAPDPTGSVSPLYGWTLVVSVIWLIGIAAMLLYGVISYVRVRRSVAERAPYEGNIFQCDHVKSPFILGLVWPKIYLPSGMDEATMESVIAHEKAHLARHDNWWKPLGFLILTVHWFNPLCWVAYVLLCRDIELACDEKVIRQMDLDGKKQYSTALLECSAQRRIVTICPLAFGEVGVKERVKNVLNYKKPAFWVIVAAVVACAVVTVCFATNPIPTSENTTVLSANYSVERVLYAVTFDGEASVEPPLQYCVTADYLLYVQQTGGEDWKYLGALTPYELTNDELNDYVPYNQRRNIKVRQITDAYILRVEDDNFYLVFQTISGDTYLSYGWEDIGERGQGVSDDTCLRCLYHLNRDPNENDAPRVDEPTPDGGGQPAPKEPDVSTLSAEQAAIRQAILDYNGSPYHKGEYDVACCSFITLETLSGTPLAGSNTNKITYYGWAFYEEYRVTDNGLETGPCSHTPVALSFDVDERGYTLTEYWTPGDGSNYAPDIWKKFPLRIVWDALDNQKFILQQTQECYEQAIAATGLDTGKVIGSLLDTICSSPAQSSDPEDYIKEHSIDYRELTYYGRYTLEYCFTEFLKGGQTDLRGHIMRAAIDDIAPEARLKLYAETGQEYFDAWKDAAISVGERHDMEWIETNQPAVYLLLNMLGEV